MPNTTWIQLYEELEELPEDLGIRVGGYFQRVTMLSISAAYGLRESEIAYELNADGVLRKAFRQMEVEYTIDGNELQRHESDRLLFFLLRESMK